MIAVFPVRVDESVFVRSAVIGELDEELDKRIDLENVKAAPLAAIWIQG